MTMANCNRIKIMLHKEEGETTYFGEVAIFFSPYACTMPNHFNTCRFMATVNIFAFPSSAVTGNILSHVGTDISKRFHSSYSPLLPSFTVSLLQLLSSPSISLSASISASLSLSSFFTSTAVFLLFRNPLFCFIPSLLLIPDFLQ